MVTHEIEIKVEVISAVQNNQYKNREIDEHQNTNKYKKTRLNNLSEIEVIHRRYFTWLRHVII